jgi:hypothetical protein
MFLPSPPKHLCNPQYKGYSVLQSDSSVTVRNCHCYTSRQKVIKISLMQPFRIITNNTILYLKKNYIKMVFGTKQK